MIPLTLARLRPHLKLCSHLVHICNAGVMLGKSLTSPLLKPRAVMLRNTGPQMKVLEHHPETNERVTDVILPMWDEVLKMVHDVARLYSPVKFQSVDLAITEKGPALSLIHI